MRLTLCTASPDTECAQRYAITNWATPYAIAKHCWNTTNSQTPSTGAPSVARSACPICTCLVDVQSVTNQVRCLDKRYPARWTQQKAGPRGATSSVGRDKAAPPATAIGRRFSNAK